MADVPDPSTEYPDITGHFFSAESDRYIFPTITTDPGRDPRYRFGMGPGFFKIDYSKRAHAIKSGGRKYCQIFKFSTNCQKECPDRIYSGGSF